MRTGVSYMGHHNPKHLATDLQDMKSLGCKDVLVAAQENDFVHMTGKLTFLPGIAADLGIRPIAIFWGALNLFGGGTSSQFLLEYPIGHQVRKNGTWNPSGCYNNPLCVERIQEMIDRIAELGFAGYFIDEPTPIDCYCESCRALFYEWQGSDLTAAGDEALRSFRAECVLHYVRTIAGYTKSNHPQVETMCCLMPCDQDLWRRAAEIDGLDNLGTDIYWANSDNDVEEMTPIVRDLAGVCEANGKKHHEWLQCWKVKAGNEQRVADQGRILVRERPGGLYIWAYEGQVGTTEACDDPAAAWSRARQVLELAKEGA